MYKPQILFRFGPRPSGFATVRQGIGRLRSGVQAIPPTGLLLLAMASIQIGAAIAKNLFVTLGTGGTVFLRVGFAAILLMIIWRPNLRQLKWSQYNGLLLLGLSIAGLNLAFYEAIARIPLGIAVTIEFIGPLGISLFGSRRWRDLIWVGLAAAGIILLAPFDGASLDPIGLGFALLAGACWAAYILFSVRVGQTLPGGSGLALAMSIAALLIMPFGLFEGGTRLLNPSNLYLGLIVALLASLIPFSLEYEALKRIPARVFGVLMSLDPVVAVIVGFVILGEQLGLQSIIAISCITLAAIGVTVFGTQRNEHH